MKKNCAGCNTKQQDQSRPTIAHLQILEFGKDTVNQRRRKTDLQKLDRKQQRKYALFQRGTSDQSPVNSFFPAIGESGSEDQANAKFSKHGARFMRDTAHRQMTKERELYVEHIRKLEDFRESPELALREKRELERQERFFNERSRTIGIDIDALDQQVMERKQREEQKARELKEYAENLIRLDHIICENENRQLKDERYRNEDITDFRRRYHQASSRREFDINDPNFLKKQEALRVIPGVGGFFVSDVRRRKREHRDWLQQQQEQKRDQELRKLKDESYDEFALALKKKAEEIDRLENQCRKAKNVAIRDFNLALASDAMRRQEVERCKEEEINNMDMLSQIQKVSETIDYARFLGKARSRRDCYKGMTTEQRLNYFNLRQEQKQDNQRLHMKMKEEDRLYDEMCLDLDQAAVQLERQEQQRRKEICKAMERTNRQLAHEQQAQKKYLRKEFYFFFPDERYFTQFNTCSR